MNISLLDFFKKLKLRKQFLIFLVAGGCAALINIISRYMLSTLIRFELAVLIAYLIGMITAYILNRRFVFLKTKESLKKSFVIFSIVNLLSVIQTLLVSIGLRKLITPIFSSIILVDLFSHGCGVMVPIFTSFFGHKYWSFRDT